MKKYVKTTEEVNLMKKGGGILVKMFEELRRDIREGVALIDIDKRAYDLCKKFDVKPAFLGYKGYPNVICANLNDIVVHGIPDDTRLKEGDILGLDLGIIYQGFYLDMAFTFGVGNLNEQTKNFLYKTFKSMLNGIKALRGGVNVGDISEAMREGLVGIDFRLMKDFAGHGIGKNLHEYPDIPGEGLSKGEGAILYTNMTVAIEAISVMGNDNSYKIDEDNWTVRTKNGCLSALYENTVLVKPNSAEFITWLDYSLVF